MNLKPTIISTTRDIYRRRYTYLYNNGYEHKRQILVSLMLAKRLCDD